MSLTEELKASSQRSTFSANSLLWEFLQNDGTRSNLYADLRKNAPLLSFKTRSQTVTTDAKGKETQHEDAFLLTRHADISHALVNFSNKPYKEIGGGSFVLASDNNDEDRHREKRAFLGQAIAATRHDINFIAMAAIQAAMDATKQTSKFDFARDYSEQVALRFTAGLFGIPDTSHVLLQESMRLVLDAMVNQMFSRHFVTDPVIMPKGNAAMGQLAALVGELINEAAAPKRVVAISNFLHADEKGANSILRELATKLRNLNSNLESSVDQFRRCIRKKKDIPFQTYQLLDLALNYGSVRQAFVDRYSHPLGNDDHTLQLVEIIMLMRADKVAIDDNLVPRRFDLHSNKPLPLLTENNDLRFRKTVIEQLIERPYSTRPAIELTGSELVTDVVGSIAGLVGNITAGCCNTMKEFFGARKTLDKANAAASLPLTKGLGKMEKLVKEALRLNPPAVMIPRQASGNESNRTFGRGRKKVVIPEGADVLIPLGAATRDPAVVKSPDKFDEMRSNSDYSYVFGHDDTSLASHRCMGERMSIPLIALTCRAALRLPGFAQQKDDDGLPLALEKKWGYICHNFPVLYNHDAAITQKPLNVIMKIKAPTSEHAETLKLIVRYGAPMIERLLASSGIVHFARFLFLNNDTELALLTTYDGSFEPYIKHFADVAGPLFDEIFAHIEDPPITPVRDNADNFVEHIRRYDQASAAGYFFSAYPQKSVLTINSK